MGDPRNLSFSTNFNQPKILANSFQAVVVPVSALFTPDTLFLVNTGAPTKPLPPRMAIEYNGVFCPAFGAGSDLLTVVGVDIAFIVSYDSSNRLVVQSYSQEAGTTNLTIHYRIYKDARSS